MIVTYGVTKPRLSTATLSKPFKIPTLKVTKLGIEESTPTPDVEAMADPQVPSRSLTNSQHEMSNRFSPEPETSVELVDPSSGKVPVSNQSCALGKSYGI